jgi:predicted nucleic acid-binding protein
MRSGRNPVTVVASLLRARRLVTCGIVRIEVLRGIVKQEAKAQMEMLFDAIPDIALDTAVIADAAQTAWSLDRDGRVLPLTDVLIGACAKRVGATVVTLDRHFARIPDLCVRDELPMA